MKYYLSYIAACLLKYVQQTAPRWPWPHSSEVRKYHFYFMARKTEKSVIGICFTQGYSKVHVKGGYRKQISIQSYLSSRNLTLFFFRSISVIFFWQIYKVLLSEQRKYTYAFALYWIVIFFWSSKYHLSDIRNVPLDVLFSFQIIFIDSVNILIIAT